MSCNCDTQFFSKPVNAFNINPTPYTSDTVLTGYEPTFLIFNVSGGQLNVTLPLAASTPDKIYDIIVLNPGASDNLVNLSCQGSDQLFSPAGELVGGVGCQTGGSAFISDGISTWYPINACIFNSVFNGDDNAVLISRALGAPDWASTVQNQPSITAPINPSNMVLSSSSVGIPQFVYGFSGINGISYKNDATFTGYHEPSYNLIDVSSNNVTITLPGITNAPYPPFDSKVYWFANVAAGNTATIVTAGSDVFADGTSSLDLSTLNNIVGLMASAVTTTWYFLTKVS